MKRNALTLVAAAAGLMLSTAAFAQAYVGIGAGPSKLSVSCADTDTCDTTGTGFKVFGGYKFTPNIAAEANYFDFGKAKATITDSELGLVSAKYKPTAIGLGVAFFGDVAPNWPGVVRLGVASVKAKASGSGAGISTSDSKTTTQAYFGLGIGYSILKNLSVDLAADFSRSKIYDETSNVRMITVGVTYSF
jgi:OmpA-OmpF porin, OOP family